MSNENSSPEYLKFLQLLSSSPEIAHSFDTLLSSLQLLNSTRPLKSFLVTSTQPEEGKTTITINLAITLALAGKRVLLVDADLRKPRIHYVLQLENAQGFTDILMGSGRVQDVTQVIKMTNPAREDTQSLSVITSGRVSPSLMATLGSSTFRRAIEPFTRDYDAILIDSPPVLSVNDAILMASVVDGVILVLNTGVVTDRDAKRAKERIEEAGGRILGVVMNRFSEKDHGPGLHPYSSYYQETQLKD